MYIIIHSWWKKYVILNTMLKKIYCSSMIQFSQYDISINVSVLNNFCGISGAHSGEDS